MSIEIKPKRLVQKLQTLSSIGETLDGMQRLAFTPADVQARRYLIQLMEQSGAKIRIDYAGNIIGLFAGSEPNLPVIALGSHTDTVPNGGKFDGALGVLGAIECLETLKDNGVVTRHPIEVINFSDEEGSRFGGWLFGSRAMSGLLDEIDMWREDASGSKIADMVNIVGGDFENIKEARRYSKEFEAYLELHIEQGPILHQAGTEIGVVDYITGRITLGVSVIGFANHAGTTPMDSRQDAALISSEIIQAVNDIATREEICRVGTVGKIIITPNAINVIPGRVYLGLEFRDAELLRLYRAVGRLKDICKEVSLRNGLEIEFSEPQVTQPAMMDYGIRTIISQECDQLGLSSIQIPSGAGHDAQSMAEISKAGMIFVPSFSGISHSPAEHSDVEDCVNGTNVLLQSVLAIDKNGLS